jgi:hypothetical protein
LLPGATRPAHRLRGCIFAVPGALGPVRCSVLVGGGAPPGETVICGREHNGADMEVPACVPVPRGSTRLGTDRGPHPGHRPHCSRATGPAPPQANGQRERSDRRTASVSWLVETCHARTTSQVTPRSTHLDAVDSRLSPPPNSLLSTLSFLLSRPQAARELAGGNVPRADDIPSHTAPHAVRRRWSNPVAPPGSPRPQAPPQANGQRELAGGNVPRADDLRVQQRPTQLDAVGQTRGHVVSCGSPGFTTPRCLRPHGKTADGAVLQVEPRQTVSSPLSPFSSLGRRPQAARDGPSGSTGGFDGRASTMGLTPHARLCPGCAGFQPQPSPPPQPHALDAGPHATGRADRRGDLTVALPPWG